MSLVWSPFISAIQSRLTQSDELELAISPFIQLGALKALLDEGVFTDDLKIITRWNPNDILSGVSDIKIYPYLKERNIHCYINSNIHLKLYIFRSNEAFHTSGNMTMRGLGISEKYNHEVGCFVNLTYFDWMQINKIINTSILVNDDIYESVIKYYKTNREHKKPIPEADFYKSVDLSYSVNALPYHERIEELFSIYSHINEDTLMNTTNDDCIHDIIAFEVPLGLDEQSFHTQLKHNFLKSPFISDIINYIELNAPLRFGAVNNWIHNKCTDVPLPSKWDVKKYTRAIYRWLEFFCENITWDIPGQRSQVIYWNKDKK